MKRLFGGFLTITLVAAAFLLAGCQAFDNTAGEPGGHIVPNAGEAPPSGTDDEPVDPTDYSLDTTECQTPASVSVAINETASLVANSGWTVGSGSADYQMTAQSVGLFSVKLAISNDQGNLSFVVKKTGTKKYSVCNIMYSDASMNSSEASGSIVIDRFLEEGENGVLNAGFYTLSFIPMVAVPPAEVKAAIFTNVKLIDNSDEPASEEAAGAEEGTDSEVPPVGAVSIQGAYYSELLQEPQVAPAPEETEEDPYASKDKDKEDFGDGWVPALEVEPSAEAMKAILKK